jgi:hypothetical protein
MADRDEVRDGTTLTSRGIRATSNVSEQMPRETVDKPAIESVDAGYGMRYPGISRAQDP